MRFWGANFILGLGYEKSGLQENSFAHYSGFYAMDIFERSSSGLRTWDLHFTQELLIFEACRICVVTSSSLPGPPRVGKILAQTTKNSRTNIFIESSTDYAGSGSHS